MKDDTRGFPRFQWSKFPEGNRDEQFVVRADDWQEFVDAKGKVEELLDASKPQAIEQTNAEADAVLAEASDGGELTNCPEHPSERVFWKDGKFGRFFSHGEKQPDGSWRNCVMGKGYKT